MRCATRIAQSVYSLAHRSARSHASRAGRGGPLNESVEDFADDVFKIGKESIVHRPETQSIEAAAKLGNRFLETSLDWTDIEDVFVVVMKKTMHPF